MTHPVRHAAACLVVLYALLAGLVPTPARAQTGCEGLVAPRLAAGGVGRVISPYGVSVKNEPATGAAGAVEIATLPQGSVFTVIAGPQCNQDYVWWQIGLASGVTGWAAEGNASDYFLEPATVGLHTYRRSPDGTTLTRYFVTPDGMARREAEFVVPPVEATPASAWQQVELDALTQGLLTVARDCPDRFAGTPWADPAARAAPHDVPLAPYDYTAYPAPDGDRLVLVRQLQLALPRCDSALPDRVGMTRITLLDADGAETELFPFPQHGSVPASQDRYAQSEPDAPNVYLDEVIWSPDGRYIAFVAAYRDACDGAACYRFHVYVWDTGAGQLYVPGEGRHVAWTDGGQQIYVLRLLAESDTQRGHLYRMAPDGTARQEIGLPGSAVAVSATQTGLGFPWNADGTRLLLGNAGVEQVMALTLTDRGLTPPVAVPDLAPSANRLAVDFVKGDTALLWTTLRGQFVLQDLREGTLTPLSSTVAPAGVPLREVRPFATGLHALLEMHDGTAYVLDLNADRLAQVIFGG